MLEQAIKSVTPSLRVRSRRVGGANYQVPIEVPARRARTLAVRWIVTFARQRREREMVERLAAEILDAINQQGGAFKRKDDMYRIGDQRVLEPLLHCWHAIDDVVALASDEGEELVVLSLRLVAEHEAQVQDRGG